MITYSVIAHYENGQDVRHYYKFDVAKRIFDRWKTSGEYTDIILSVAGENVFDVDMIEKWRAKKMKNYEEICKHVLDCIEAVYDSAETEDKSEWSDPIEGGMHLIINDFVASLEPRENADLTLGKFIRYNHHFLAFEYDCYVQEHLLKSWGIESDDVDTDYHRAIYPFVKMAYDDVMEGME